MLRKQRRSQWVIMRCPRCLDLHFGLWSPDWQCKSWRCLTFETPSYYEILRRAA